jgi:GNAT acetyltransferase-like protein
VTPASETDRETVVPVGPRSHNRTLHILHAPPGSVFECKWRACLAASDFPTHYTAPELFSEPLFRSGKGFAILSAVGDEVTGVLTGIKDGDCIRSGLSVRPQITLRRGGDAALAMEDLVAGLLLEADGAKLIELFVWTDMASLIEPRFRRRQYEGVVMLDLSRGASALFRDFSENKKRNIKRALKSGVLVAPATSADEIHEYYKICVDWSRRKCLPIPTVEGFKKIFVANTNRLLFLARDQNKIIAGVVIRFFPQGVMEYAANSSLESSLHLRPNDLLHWRIIEWGCRAGMTKYNLGGAHLFLRKFGGQLVPTTRCRLDLSIFRKYTIRDWLADRIDQARLNVPQGGLAIGGALRRRTPKLPAGGVRSQSAAIRSQ